MQQVLTSISEVADRYKMHPRTASSRLERAGYKLWYRGDELCFYADERTDGILSKPVRHVHRKLRRLPEQQELPLGIEPENKTENPQVGREFEIGKKVVVALVAELPNVSITVKA